MDSLAGILADCPLWDGGASGGREPGQGMRVSNRDSGKSIPLKRRDVKVRLFVISDTLLDFTLLRTRNMSKA